MIQNIKSFISGKLVYIIIGYIPFHILSFGFQLLPCIHTSQRLPISPEFLQGEIITTENMHVVRKESHFCTQTIPSSMIIGEESYDFFSEFYPTLDSIKGGEQLTLEAIVAETKHGLTTIDSGKGPIYYVIVKDKNNKKYSILDLKSTFHDSRTRTDLFSFYSNNTKMGSLLFENGKLFLKQEF